MRMHLISIYTVLFALISASAIAEETVRVPAQGAQADGYVGCAIEKQAACTAADVKTKKIKAFRIDARPVTNAEVQACIASGKCQADDTTKHAETLGADTGKAGRPAVVSYRLAEQYCASAGKKLPAEEQWLAAAMQGGVKKYPWGDEPLKTAAAQVQLDHFDMLVDAGAMPNDQIGGVYDMAGNGYEWIDAPLIEGEYEPGTACIVINSRTCLGAAPLPLYQRIGIEEHTCATFRCVQDAE